MRVIVVIAGDAVPSVHLQAHNGSPEEIDEVLAGQGVLAAIRICSLTATRLTLSLSQSVSGSRYRPPWVCYRSHHPGKRHTDYGCGLMQPGAGPGKRGACWEPLERLRS